MANPFLMTDPEVGGTQVSSTNSSFNPFLASNDLGNTFNDNPFMNVFSTNENNSSYETGNSSTNPFAFGTESDSNNQDFFSSQTQAEEPGVNYEDIFSSAPKPTQKVDVFNDFDVASDQATDTTSPLLINKEHSPPAEMKSTDMFMTDLSDTLMGGDSGRSTPKAGGPPRRPPPPRPVPPKETKDLILSVTGAMEATSSHLLDRLQATRTPSPTPMRDLHSPSPTQFGDLLEVGEGMSYIPEQPSERQEINLLGDFEFSMEPTPQPASKAPHPGVEPMVPMDMAGGNIVNAVLEAESPIGATSPPQRPAPPAVPGRPKPPPPQPSRPPPPQQPSAPHVEPDLQQESDFLSEIVTAEPLKDSSFADVFGSETQVPAMDIQEDVFAQPSENEPVISTAPFGEFTAEFNSNVNTQAPFEENANVSVMDDFASMDFAPQEGAEVAQQVVSAFDVFDVSVKAPEPPRKSDILQEDEFDAFTAKFESACFTETKAADPFDPFGSSAFGQAVTAAVEEAHSGFGGEDNFDSFLALRDPPPVPQGTPARISRGESAESDNGNDFNIFIKPKTNDDLGSMASDTNVFAAALAPPPKSPVQPIMLQDTSPRFNPFDNNQEIPMATTENIFAQEIGDISERTLERTDSHETPPTPLFDEDVSQPLEDFPRINYEGPGWEMQLRQPNKKKITGQRFWKKIFLRLVYQGENPVLQLFNNKDEKDPFQELPLQPCYSVSEIGAQQYDQYGKIFTIKLQFIFYKERPGVRPGQVTKAERITNKLSQFAAYAIQGDYQGVKEFGSDLKKLGLPVEHAPQISQLFKIGSHTYEDMKQFSMCVEEALFRLSAHRDRALNYKMEEVQITAVDELYVEQNSIGAVEKQIARVRLFFLGFLSGMPDVELGVNDLVRQGKEVVGRHDIIPVVTEEWIRLEGVEFHSCVQQDEYEKTRTIRFKPPDACYIELMRFRVRPPKNRELPLQLKCTICVTGNKVELHADILVPGFTSRKLGQIPCEDVMVRIPIPECWIYLFRVEKHFRYGSVKSAHRRTGKIKGIERILGAVDNLETSLMEVTSGQAKYEHQHRAIVWRMPRLPKEGQGAYTTHNLVCRMALTSFDQIPEELAKYCYVEFTMPATTVSHTTVRSVSIANSDSDNPPEKYVRQLSRHEYRVEIEHTQGEGPGDYIAATVSKPAPPPIAEEAPPAPPAAAESDSDSSG